MKHGPVTNLGKRKKAVSKKIDDDVMTELKNLKHSIHTIALSKGTIFVKKCLFFAKKYMLTSEKLREPWY